MLQRMIRRYPSVHQYGGKEHPASASVDSTVRILDHLDRMSSTDEQTRSSSCDS